MEFLLQLRGGVLKTLLRWVLGIFAVLIGLCVTVVVAVWMFPQLIINDRALIAASHLAARAGVNLSWDQGHVAVDSPGILIKRIHLDFTGLCVRMPSNGIDACFNRAQLTAAGGLKGLKPRVTEIGPVDLRDGKVIYAVSETKPSAPNEEKAESPKKGSLIPAFLANARLLPMHVDVPSWEIRSEDSRITGDLGLDGRSGQKGEAQIDVNAHAATRPGKQSLAASLELENPRGFLTLDGWKLAAKAQGSLPDGTSVEAGAQLDPRPGAGPLEYEYLLNAKYQKQPAQVTVQAAGQASPDGIFARLSGTASHLAPQLEKAWVDDCEVRLERESSETRPGALHLNCPIEAKLPTLPKEFPQKMGMPEHAGIRVMADLKSGAFPPSADAPVDGKVSVELNPLQTDSLDAGGKVESQLAGVPQDFPSGWKMDTDLGLKLKVTHFERLVKILTNTPFDVWAPAHTLKGQVELAIEGRFDSNSGSAPVKLKTQLASEKQKLNIDAKGNVRLEHLHPSPLVHLSLDLALNEVTLELPPLPRLPSPSNPRLDPLPQFLPDGRISAEGFAKQEAGIQAQNFTYDITVHTPDEAHPVRFLTPQVQTPIPLALNLRVATGQPPVGQIKVLGFPVTLFRRQVQVDHVTVTYSATNASSRSGQAGTLDGRITVPYTDYTITILLLGTTDKPQIRFLSEPPLPDDQIIAVLLFGKPMDSLDADQQQSIGNSRAALSRGVLSLASLYYLSAVNVESIDYDPDTRTASVSFRLAEGTSLNMSQSAGGAAPSVGVRRRLSKHLAITTTLNNPSTQQTNRTVSTYLEWAYQY